MWLLLAVCAGNGLVSAEQQTNKTVGMATLTQAGDRQFPVDGTATKSKLPIS